MGMVWRGVIEMFQRTIFALALLVCIKGIYGEPLKAAGAAQSADAGGVNPVSHQTKGKPSLIEAAPKLYKTAKRYPKFYGDENTTHGDILERSELFGNPSGVRDYLVDHGFYFDYGVTQFLQSNVSGGNKTTPSARVNGSTDAWLWFDTGKAGLWPNGAAFLHGEGQWSWSINGDVGSTLPANDDATMPTSDPDASQWALSEAYILQGLPGNLLLAAGKMDLAAWADTNVFANNERTQFVYTGLIDNAIIGSFVPYTALAAWLAWSPSKEHSLVGIFSQTDGAATVTGFDTLFNSNNTLAAEYKFSPIFGKRPGNYHIIFAYTSKEATNFQISDRQFIAEATGMAPVDEENYNYTLLLNFDQYLWVDEKSADAYARHHEKSSYSGFHRHHNSPVGIGLIGRADREVPQVAGDMGSGPTDAPIVVVATGNQHSVAADAKAVKLIDDIAVRRRPAGTPE